MSKVKKMFATLMFGFSLMLCSQMVSTNTAAAQDIWAYSFKDGGAIYVMSETIRFERYVGYHVTIKDVEGDGSYSKVKLILANELDGWWYINEEAIKTSRMARASNDPKMEAIINVVLQYAE